MQVFDTFVVSGFGANFTMLHQLAAGHGHRILKLSGIPVLENCHIETYVGWIQSVVGNSTPEKTAKLVDGFH